MFKKKYVSEKNLEKKGKAKGEFKKEKKRY
jgi:hypothetical protein